MSQVQSQTQGQKPQTVVIKAGHRADPVDLNPIDPDRTQHVHPEAEWVVVSHGLGQFARGDRIARSDLPDTSDEHLAKLLKNGALVPVSEAPPLAKSPNAGKPAAPAATPAPATAAPKK